MKRIFVTGCHRSGTTMMRLILNSHPSIHCFDEWYGYKAIENNDYTNPKNAEIVGFKIPNWVDLLVHSKKHRAYYNNDPIIFMMRDVRAVIASMLTLPTGNGTWFAGAVSSINKWTTNKGCTPEFFAELAKTDTLTEPDYRKVAMFWRHKTSQYFNMIKLGWQVLPFNYENTVTRPMSCLKILCNFIEVPYHEDMLKHHQKEHDETPGGKGGGDTDIKRAVDKSSLYKWKKVLTKSQEQAILETAGELNDYVSMLRFTESTSSVD